MMRTRRYGTALATVVLALAAGCTSPGPPPEDRMLLPTSGQHPTAEPRERPRVGLTRVVGGLDVPWGLAALPDERLLVSLRDSARLVVVELGTGATTPVSGPGADRLAAETVPGGEAGLLGVAVAPPDAERPGEVFVYRTGADDNAVLRGTLDGAELGGLTPVVEGIPRAANHDGGALAFGPDGHLYVGTGDAGDTANAQDPGSLGGKILRVTTDGEPAPGNPEAGSRVWTSGHRNVQGLGWDQGGRMFASEFGQNTWDELNVIVAGGNYGWPDAEGPAGSGSGGGFVDPVAWWSPAEASPSGLTVTADAVYLAGLRGETLWRVPFLETADQTADQTADEGADETADEGADVDRDGDHPGLGRPQALLVGELGRLRNVRAVAGTDRTGLWLLTSNTDGRGTPREGDDRLVHVTLG